MKVVLLAPTPPPVGGIASWTNRMLQAHLKNGWEVSVVDEKMLGGREVFGNNTQKNYFTEIKRCSKIWKNLVHELKDPETKVVHSCIPSATLSMIREFVCAVLTKIYGKKFIIHFRCTVPNTTKGRFGHWVLKRLCNISSFILVLNKQSEIYLSDKTKTPIKIIPNFISENEIVENHVINENVKTVLYTGGVIESKGVIDIINVAQSFPNIKFKLIGNPDSKIQEFVKEKNINNVCLLGVKDKSYIKDEFKKADVFMFLSYFRGEGFSNSLVEAMAAGLPCVVTDWAANHDMIEDKGGFAVPIKTPAAAIDALKKCLPKEIREKQSEFNILKVKNEYIGTVVLDKYVQIYDNLTKNK